MERSIMPTGTIFAFNPLARQALQEGKNHEAVDCPGCVVRGTDTGAGCLYQPLRPRPTRGRRRPAGGWRWGRYRRRGRRRARRRYRGGGRRRNGRRDRGGYNTGTATAAAARLRVRAWLWLPASTRPLPLILGP